VSKDEKRWERRVLLINRRKEIATGLFPMIMDGDLDPWLTELELLVKLNVSVRIPMAPTRAARIALLGVIRALVDEQIEQVANGDEGVDDGG